MQKACKGPTKWFLEMRPGPTQLHWLQASIIDMSSDQHRDALEEALEKKPHIGQGGGDWSDWQPSLPIAWSSRVLWTRLFCCQDRSGVDSESSILNWTWTNCRWIDPITEPGRIRTLGFHADAFFWGYFSSFFFLHRQLDHFSLLQATQKDMAGHIWPTGHEFDNVCETMNNYPVKK